MENLVDKIVSEVLNRQSRETTTIFSQPNISRPNYQREKGKERLLGIKAPESGNKPGQSFFPQLNPSGTLFTISMKPPEKINTGFTPVDEQIEVKAKVRGSEITEKSFGQAKFIGVSAGNTVGYVIPNLEPGLSQYLQANRTLRAIGVISSRVGAAAQIMAADEAVKKTNSELIRLELARDELGGPGHGVFALFGAEDVADVIRAVEIALKATEEYYQNIKNTPAGKIETHYTARAAAALNKAFGAPLNQAFGIIIGAPAGVGLLMSDTALKTAHVTMVSFWGPSVAQAFANEVWFTVTGDSAAVKNALEAAREVGLQVLAEFRA
ncbi:propanediol utilization microcompartment protein PduB [Carboxydothermus ferrireducens]|uniref:Microcompartment protein PduB n=1 Tax=Carboxydothermus ferrireducens DSM 11255 TaxID=1119529 RepID=A0ABX2R652_9THEO|nr:propanediol utilization microcompartment protein PduB [Carboxydothermus ferrireducens]NYE56550.1 microcompartment protein PduB [Carboxydothermus ferrireducens DSM 11255]